jgi:F0F1-type ATP synthase epsilon subunit
MVKRQDASTGEIVESEDSNKPATKKEDTVHIKIYSPFKTYFDNEAKSISAVNDTGPFDVLPKHHRFMTLLNPCDLVVRTIDGQQQKIRITRGIMHVREDNITVFLDV